MKQVLENFRTGKLRIEEVPPPSVREGFVLVKNHYSLISSGTEGGTVKLGKMSLIGKARARPEQALKVLNVARTQGILTAYNAAMRSLEMPIILGYCCAGEVIGVGVGVTEFKIGDMVACGGAGYANHAEIVNVPKNLCVKIPDGVNSKLAAFTTLGSIALQSLRIADTKLGDYVVVIGMGLVGLLVMDLLQASGCHVFGIDINQERIDFAKNNIGYEAASLEDANLEEQVKAFTKGQGADSIIITASTEDNSPVRLAGQIARQKGKVVVVGRTVMEAPRETFLFKELELLTSMAYGPGTGDIEYEEKGYDYPIAYVRWTENRNMQAFLSQVECGHLSIEKLITHEYPLLEADKAFDLITSESGNNSIGILLKYDHENKTQENKLFVINSIKTEKASDVVVGVIGAGSYATNEFLPLLAKEPNIRLKNIVSANGVRANSLGKKYSFEECSSDPLSVINDSEINCVFILTRHDTHAEYTAQSLRAGKHVFVEKPLALTYEELDTIKDALQNSNKRLMVGFNRRYAGYAIKLKELFKKSAQPMSISYCVNVGFRPEEHWLHDPIQGGGVILGEACHHIDFCNWLVDDSPINLTARTIGSAYTGIIPEDNVHINMEYKNGTIAHIAYLSNGNKSYPAERIDVFCDNMVASITDFKIIEIAKGIRFRRSRLWFKSDKGHRRQIVEFLKSVKDDNQLIDIESYLSSSLTAINVANLVKSNRVLSEANPSG